MKQCAVDFNAPSKHIFEYRMSEKRRNTVASLQRYSGWSKSDVGGPPGGALPGMRKKFNLRH